MRHTKTALLEGISKITLLDELTIETRIEKDIEFNLQDAIRTNDAIEEIGNGRKLFHLTIYGDRTVPSKEARSFVTSDQGSCYKLAEAIVVGSLSQKMVFNFMINVERPNVRTKLFTSVQDAKDWLQSLQN